MKHHILAIDPGTTESGFVVWTGASVAMAGVLPNEELLQKIQHLASDGVRTLAIEEIGHFGSGMPAGKEVFLTCRWSGRFQQRWEDSAINRSQLPVRFVLRATIKTHLCGTPRAKDPNVGQAVRDRVGPKGTGKQPGPTYGVTSHAIQALALALVVADLERIAA